MTGLRLRFQSGTSKSGGEIWLLHIRNRWTNRNPRLTLSKDMEEYTAGLQKEFMPEDSDFGMVEAYLEKKGNEYTCIKEIYCVVFN